MDINNLNRLIEKVIIINSHVGTYETNPLLVESRGECIREIKLQYESFLSEKLFEVYDDYFSDYEMRAIEEYLTSEGVDVEGDDFEEIHSKLTIRPFPLRIVVTGANHTFKEVMWKAA